MDTASDATGLGTNHQGRSGHQESRNVNGTSKQTVDTTEDAASRDLIVIHDSPETREKVLQSLRFPDMELRQDTIVDSHQSTFEWIFAHSESPIRDWLRASRGIFWVNGKAGSGKSTLMKYIVNDVRTRTLLRSWAGNKPLVLANFYFWYLGSPLQKTEEGLLRSMLYQILCKCPYLMSVATARRWLTSGRPDESWSLQELRGALKSVAMFEHAPRFCFFIDGLDEYHADHLHLVELLKDLSTHDTFKICVSSRPWNVFEQAFGNVQDQIILENLTRPDIELYVQDNLGKPFHYGPEVLKLINEVIAKAQGVFLWVYLTVKSLREGFVEGDSVFILRQRLDLLPSDLESYFDLILSRVHPVYKKSTTMSALYLATLATRQELFKEENKEDKHAIAVTRSFLNFWLLRQGIEDPNFAIAQEFVEMNAATCAQFARSTRRFLSACCKDLLYLPLTSDRYTVESKVEFLHRTAYEYLESDEMRPKVEAAAISHLHEQDIGVSLALARLKYINLNLHAQCTRLVDGLGPLLAAFGPNPDRPGVLAEVDRVATHSLQYCHAECRAHVNSTTLAHCETLVAGGHHVYVAALLERKKFNRPEKLALLRSALVFPLEGVNDVFLRFLLSWDVDVNAGNELDRWVNDDDWAKVPSLWRRFILRWAETGSGGESTKDNAKIWTTAKIMIENGAIVDGYDDSTANDALYHLVPAEYQQELHQLLNKGPARTQDYW